MTDERLTSALGWASLGLGVPQLLAPDRFARAVGVRPGARTRVITAVACGARELAAGAGILALERRRPLRTLRARVAGDLLDLALLGAALGTRRADPRRAGAAMAAVAGVAAADVVAARRVSRADANLRARAAVTIRRPRADVYAFWRDFANLPAFMLHLESVKLARNGRSHWKARAPIGTVEWDAEIVDERPGELIAWRSLHGSDVEHEGSVCFREAPGDRGTEVHVELRYAARGGSAGVALSKLTGEEPRQQLNDDLRRFKQVMETGEVARSEGSPEGHSARRQLKQRPAQPVEVGAP